VGPCAPPRQPKGHAFDEHAPNATAARRWRTGTKVPVLGARRPPEKAGFTGPCGGWGNQPPWPPFPDGLLTGDLTSVLRCGGVHLGPP